MATVEQVRKWLRHARKGDRFCYYEGFLMQDRGSDNRDQRTDEQSAIGYLADSVQEIHKRGAVTLFQKRRGHGVYSYYAQKR